MVDDEATKDFVIETREGLDQLDREFVALEADPAARERIATVFRAIHTIKGTAGFLGFSRLEKLAHSGESLLSLLRDGTIGLTPAIASALLAVVDRVRSALVAIEATGAEDAQVHDELIARLNALRTGEPVAAPAVTEAPPAVADAAPPPIPTPAPDLPPPPPVPASVATAVPAAVATPLPVEAPKTVEPASPASDSNVRVDVRLLDKLMDLVGELVLARNQVTQFGTRVEDPSFTATAQRLNLVTTELQEHVMKTRMQPINSMWSRLPRVVRDLAIACGKQVRVEMYGKETELDRTILEAVKDPLTHVVRNAIDHGIEAPAARATRGKPRTGSLILRAFHEGGQVIIEVSDDGNGLDADAIRRKATERGLVSTEQLARMSDHELAQLVFLPGFSTARQVTNVSGRGVGMDVVKTNVERIGGTVDLLSRPGQGTTIRIRIPLTLAIIPALMVAQGEHRYAIPQANLVELVRVEGKATRTAIERIHSSPVYRLRGQLLPIVDLGRALDTSSAPPPADIEDARLNIVVLQADDRMFGVIIDDIRDTEEIVVKPLGTELKGISVFAGATIMGDGRVSLILDVVGLAHHAGVARVRKDDASVATRTERGGVVASADAKQALLLFAMRDGATVALPLAEVARLEELAIDQLERTRNGFVVQHRGSILPLVDLAGAEQRKDGDSLSVIVYARAERTIGLIVDRIVDVVDETLRLEHCGTDGDVLGAAIVQGKVTELVDLHAVIRRHAPWFLEGEAA